MAHSPPILEPAYTPWYTLFHIALVLVELLLNKDSVADEKFINLFFQGKVFILTIPPTVKGNFGHRNEFICGI